MRARARYAKGAAGRGAQMAMGAHTEKDRAPAVDAIATRFSSMLDDMSALTSW